MRAVQPIFQNPYEAFNPLKRVDRYLFSAAYRFTGARWRAAHEEACRRGAAKVGLSLVEVRGRFPHELSGGQLAAHLNRPRSDSVPALLVADEPVSMVDASLRMSIVNLFKTFATISVSIIYITHDLATAYYISDRVLIMQKGRVVNPPGARGPLSSARTLYDPPQGSGVVARRRRHGPPRGGGEGSRRGGTGWLIRLPPARPCASASRRTGRERRSGRSGTGSAMTSRTTPICPTVKAPRRPRRPASRSGLCARPQSPPPPETARPPLNGARREPIARGSDGNPVYSWAILDRIFDTYVDLGLTPFVQVGFMPEALSVGPPPYRHDFPRGAITTGWAFPPRDYDRWAGLIEAWTVHLTERYGRDAVALWPFEVWNEPDGLYWRGSSEEFCRLFDVTAAAIRRVLPEARVGGPHTCGPTSVAAARFLREFLGHCARGRNHVSGGTGTRLDFIAFHAKGKPVVADSHVRMGLARQLNDIATGLDIVREFPEYRATPVILGESIRRAAPPVPRARTLRMAIATGRSMRPMWSPHLPVLRKSPSARKPSSKARSPGPSSSRIRRSSPATANLPPTA